MSSVLSFVPPTAGFPPRASNLSEVMPLVLVFAREPSVLPFVRYLLNEYGVASVADWDRAPAGLLDRFDLPEEAKSIFRKRVGRPTREAHNGRVVRLAHRLA